MLSSLGIKLARIAIVVAIFALGLFPNEPMSKTERAALEYRTLVTTARAPAPAVASVTPAPETTLTARTP